MLSEEWYMLAYRNSDCLVPIHFSLLKSLLQSLNHKKVKGQDTHNILVLLWTWLNYAYLMNLLKDKSEPALNQPREVGFSYRLNRVIQHQS